MITVKVHGNCLVSVTCSTCSTVAEVYVLCVPDDLLCIEDNVN